MKLKLILSLITVGLIWGTTYLGIRVAVQTMQPWYITTIRQGIASLILLVILLYKKELKWIGWEAFRFQFIVSMLMIVVANGFTTMAEKSVTSGLTSILSSLSPLVVFVLGMFFGTQKPSLKGLFGVLLGFVGVLCIFRKGLTDILDPGYQKGIFFLSIAILSWSMCTIYLKKNIHKSENIKLNLFYQFSIAAVVQFILALIFEGAPDVEHWSVTSILATIYLAVFGSVITFFAYHYALKRVTALQVSILNYINTIIAVFLGWLLLKEPLRFDFIIATVFIILGVFIINQKDKK